MSKLNVASVQSAVSANPGTTTGTLGAVVVLIGAQLGWDDATTAQVAGIALILVPVVRTIVTWWQSRHAAAGA